MKVGNTCLFRDEVGKPGVVSAVLLLGFRLASETKVALLLLTLLFTVCVGKICLFSTRKGYFIRLLWQDRIECNATRTADRRVFGAMP